MPFYTLNLSNEEYYALEDILVKYYSSDDHDDINQEAFHSLIEKLPAISHRLMYL